MGKAKNNLRKYQKENVSQRTRLICGELLKLWKDKALFKDISGLANRLAEMVTLQEKKLYQDGKIKYKRPVNYTTFIRANSHYKHLLLSYMEGDFESIKSMAENGIYEYNDVQSKRQKINIETLLLQYPGIKAMFIKYDLSIKALNDEIRQIKDERNRMKQYIEGTGRPKRNHEKEKKTKTQLQTIKDDMDKTVTALTHLINRYPFIEINWKRRAIIDLADSESKALEKSIINKELLEPYFRHAKKNDGIIEG